MNLGTHSNVRLLVCATTLAGAILTGAAAAADHNVTVAMHVSAQGLDLSQPADAKTLYTRLENAAWVACTRGNRADLLPVDNVKACYENSLAAAVRSVKAAQITMLYLGHHTLQEATAHGIDIAVLASK
jgi:UrcA family protein